MSMDTFTCLFCGKEFQNRRPDKRYCCHAHYHAHKRQLYPIVTIKCCVCGTWFEKAHRFRHHRTCSKRCFKQLLSRQQTHERIVRKCSQCGKKFERRVSDRADQKNHFCTYECFATWERGGKPATYELTCEHCGKKFVKPYLERDRRFCSYKCANTGKNNGMYGKPGPMLGKPAWNRGLTAKIDNRLKIAGKKISKIQKESFRIGKRSNKGRLNPNYGNTFDKISDEKRENFSKAAIKRVLLGQSGYKTKHVTGTYTSPKCNSPVKFKSSWELIAMMYWDKDETVKSFQYEPFVVKIKNGKRSIPDFIVEYIDSTKIVYEIKPTMISMIESVRIKLQLTSDVLLKMGYNYELIGNEKIQKMKKLLGDELNEKIEYYSNRK